MPTFRMSMWNRTRSDRSHASRIRRGLTLLELLVVISILGLVAALVTFRVGGPQQRAMLQQATGQWEFADGQLRLHARRTGRPTSLEFELGSNRLQCAFEAEAAASVRDLGHGVHVAKFISPTRELSRGPVVVRFSPQGTSETYAVKIQGAGSEARWLLVAGITGQVSEVPDEQTAQHSLEVLLPPGIHSG